MASTSMKHRNFVAEPILSRPVTDVPGIGDATARILRIHNIILAEQLLGDYLKVMRDEYKYMNLLTMNYGVPKAYAARICAAMREFSQNFLG